MGVCRVQLTERRHPYLDEYLIRYNSKTEDP
jgi:hypothetical protein